MILDKIQNISVAIAEKLVSMQIHTYWDLLLHIPLRYEDLTQVTAIAESGIGRTTFVEGEIIACEVVARRRRQLQVIISDGNTHLTLIFFHFYPNYASQYQVGKRIRAYGEIKPGIGGGRSMMHPKIRSVQEQAPQAGLAANFSPIYSTVNGLSQANISKLVDSALELLDDTLETLPQEIIQAQQLYGLAQALRILHKLTTAEFANNAHVAAMRRLKLDELLAQQLILLNVYQQKHQALSQCLKPKATYTKALLASLPFKLTTAQTRVLGEIYADIAKTTQMNRLLQGDVGSGKTIVATLAMLVAVENWYQACIIAPTEILAEQHYLKTQQLLEHLKINVVWLSGSLTPKQKETAYAQITSGGAQIVIGTHAVFQKDVVFANLALIVVDEQHRFGVEQRLLLQAKGNNPHQLMMSATPIPRTLAMSYYADLDVSTIDELPPGRTPIETLLINNNRRHEVVAFVKQMVNEGAQVYWVCPLIEESEKLDLENAINTYNELAQL